VAGPVDAFLKLSVAVSLLGAAGSVGYYYSIYLPGRDAQLDRDRKQEAARAEYSRQAEQARLREAEIRSAEEKRETEERQAAALEAVQLRYRGCVRSAEDNYSANWARECKKTVDTAAAKYKQCFSEKPTEKSWCDTLYSDRNLSPTNCALPRVVAQDITEVLDKGRKRCLDESRAGLQ
jgi:hypothetical protein